MGKSDQFDRPGSGSTDSQATPNPAKASHSGANRGGSGPRATGPKLEDSSLVNTVDVVPPGGQAQAGDSALIVTKVPLPGEAAASNSSDSRDDSSDDGLTADLAPGDEPGNPSSKPVRASRGPVSSPGPTAFPVKNWDRYEFLGLLGQGGMGAVYKARDKRLKRVVALKFIRGDDERLTKRFLQEARAQARVDHRGICKVLEVGEVEGKSYIAMQLIEGQSLQQAKPQLSIQEKVSVIRDAAVALDAAHELGIIHRDIKPANIMIERSAAGELQPVIMDFGLARDANDENTGMTESGAIMGTAAFMSPEQARGDVKRLDRRTDVYSLGATLYDLLAGKPPFAASSMADTLLKVIIEEAPPLREVRKDIPETLDIIVSKCLNKEPEQRYQTAKEFADDLSRFLSSERIVGKRLSIVQRLRWRAKNNPRTAIAVTIMILSVIGFLGQGINAYVQNIKKEREAKRQAELAQRLGQEITVMEWLLRTARGMPVHDLNREKKIVRERMASLQSEFSRFGSGGRALAHYALGRGHMGLHEYPEALTELRQAIEQGFTQGDAYYALGVVLGKHYEQAMHEARLAGGGEWAKKKLQEIEPKFLHPAIDALTKSREAKANAPEYLEALIAFYKRDYETALRQADIAVQKAPWLYEATKLQGDVHLERALQARDSGKYEEADREFAAAVTAFTAAGAIGESDGEVFEGLAETWVRKMEMLVDQGQPIGRAYEDAVAAGERISAIEPQNINGHMKIAFAAEKTMSLVGVGKGSADRIDRCFKETYEVLQQKPNNEYATEIAALCHLFLAELEQSRGVDPEPTLRKSTELLQSAIRANPQFLWGLNDLSTAFAVLGMHLQSKGSASARGALESSLAYAQAASRLDPNYLTAIQNSIFIWSQLTEFSLSTAELNSIRERTDALYEKCMIINSKHQQCNVNYLLFYARFADLMSQSRQDVDFQILKVISIYGAIRNIGGSFLDAEQHMALVFLISAIEKNRRNEDPGEAIHNAEQAIRRCFSQSKEDVMCEMIAMRIDWIRAARQQDPLKQVKILQDARDRLQALSTRHPNNVDIWQMLGEANWRMARSVRHGSRGRNQSVQDGIFATDKALTLNAHHVRSIVTQAELMLLSAGLEATDQQTATKIAAKQLLDRVGAAEPLLSPAIAARIAKLSDESASLLD